ncbi:YbhB/YbcL family Raf kinase inhibitor-like protein [Candidatus Nomurabacteria bacterium]|nr:YbhB/YbcL family Raf kinase inhibitor-like protein [Candidatus Nomurabacteria bacterium]
MNNSKFWEGIILGLVVGVLIGYYWVGKTESEEDYVAPQTSQTENMKIESSSFENNGTIPVQYTCNGAGLQPALQISGVPDVAKSLALIAHDPDAPLAGGFTHWVVWNIDPKTTLIENAKVPAGAVEGFTGSGKPGWVAPCPPSGVHHYNFQLYALDISLSIPKSSKDTDLIAAMNGHTIGNATLVGLYGK